MICYSPLGPGSRIGTVYFWEIVESWRKLFMVGIAGMVELFGDEWVDYQSSDQDYCSMCPSVPAALFDTSGRNAERGPDCPMDCVLRPVVKKGSVIQLLVTLAFCTPHDDSDPGHADQRSPLLGYC